MNSPLVLFKNTFPEEVINHIQSFIINEHVYEALRNYFNNLYDKKESHNEFIWDNYVYPKCFCDNCPDNGVTKIFKRRDCDECFKFEYTLIYMPEDFQHCIWDNNQFQKIYYKDYNNLDYHKCIKYYDKYGNVYYDTPYYD